MSKTVPLAPDFSRAVQNPKLMEAALALLDNRLHDAEPLLRAHLKSDPFDVAAIRMMAELAGRIGRFVDAENLLRRAVELAPGFTAARSNLASLLYRQGRPTEAIAELDQILEFDPDNLGLANLKAAASGRIGDYDEAIALYDIILAAQPNQEKIWMSFGHVLKTVGRLEDSVAAYRRALAIRPSFGEVWWSLANLKTVTFSDGDIDVMTAHAETLDISDEDRFHLEFALGKSLEDRAEWATSFTHYSRANALRRAKLEIDPEANTKQIDRHTSIISERFFEERATGGCSSDAPIFVLGMPRAGSTLIEQILASHSQIEGTQELPDIAMLSQQLAKNEGQYAEAIRKLSPDRRRELGDEYLKRTKIHRKTDKPHFVDKMPNNWLNVAFIHLILPNAKIIDARRHPMDCCFSNFRQHFARGQSFAYSLEDIGHYYRDYVGFMQQIDQALPGRVHRVIHEHLVDDTEAEVRRMLAYLALPFEEDCLRFWENKRAVQTPSAEQVRRPINRDGADRWQHYEEWLMPLKDALGPVLGAYPDVPA